MTRAQTLNVNFGITFFVSHRKFHRKRQFQPLLNPQGLEGSAGLGAQGLSQPKEGAALPVGYVVLHPPPPPACLPPTFLTPQSVAILCGLWVGEQ